MSEAATGEGGAIRLERIGAIGRVMLDASGGPGGAEAWSRSAATYEAWMADANVYGGLIRQAAPGRLQNTRDIDAWVGQRDRHHGGATAELADLYRLIWTIDRFSKPTVALLDGEVSWSDFCLVRHGTHKVVGESFQLSFEAPGGWFTDAGATWWLARLPGYLGEFLGLTGVTIDGTDAVALGLATHRIATATFGDIERAYADADPIDQVLDGLPQLTGGGEIEQVMGVVSEAFGGPDYAAITAKLTAAQADLAGVLGGRLASGHRVANPDLVLSLIREARRLTLQQTLERDFAIALALSAREPRPFTGMKSGEHDAYRARAAAELALKPPATVPEALG
jgi:enoyl-CoA hydratase